MVNSNSILLNHFFTRNTFKQAIDGGEGTTYFATIHRYIDDYQCKTNEECISEIYQRLKSEHQNEYYYKNTLLNKLLLGVHSPRTTTALTEVHIGNSKADFILINGKAVVYEIKTTLDNFDRLDGQISDYYKAFTHVIVVTSEKNLDQVRLKLQNSPAGICVLTNKETLSIRRKPVECRDALSKLAMFKVLRKSEYERIITKCYGSLPNVSQFDYYRVCQALFQSLPMDIAYKLFIQALKMRIKIDIVEYAKVPYELKFLIYFSNCKKSDYAELNRFLRT